MKCTKFLKPDPKLGQGTQLQVSWAQMKSGNAINIPADDPVAKRHPNSGIL